MRAGVLGPLRNTQREAQLPASLGIPPEFPKASAYGASSGIPESGQSTQLIL